MDPIEQFLQDSYKKYKNRLLTPEELTNIKSTYGSDSKLLVTDVLKKFNKPYDDGTINKITSTYGFGTQNTTPTTQNSTSGAIDHNKVKSVIGALESDNNYSAMNRDTSARGKYQHMWSEHGSQITQVTGIKDEATYLKTPEAQEKYQEYLQPMYEKQLPKLKKIAIEQGKDYSDEELMYLIHHSWVGNAEKFLKGQDVPDKIGLEKALAKSREQGLTTPRNVTNKLIQENTDFISVNGVLPTRAGKEFKSPVDKRIVDKLSGFMQDHGLVVTDTNDTKIHKSKDQQTGKSLDVNFDDKSINPDKVKAAVIDGQKRGLKLVYEVKDKRVYDQFIKSRPDLKDHVAYIPAATGNHFSVYHADNYDTDANLLGSSKIIPKERLQEIKTIKSKIIGASRRAGKVRDSVDSSIGITGITNKVTRLFTEEEQYRKAAADMFASGQLNVKDFTNEELAEIYNVKAEIVDMEKQSKIAKKRVQDQLADKGILEGVGDFFAGSVLDQIAGVGSADRLDTDNGKININYKDRSLLGNNSKYLTPEEILNLTAHPEAADPKNPNDPKNKALRGIQKILVSGDSLEFDAKTKADTLRREFSATRLQNLEKEIIKVGGKDILKTLSALGKKNEEGSITEQESQQLQALQQKLENNGGLLSKYGEQVEQYNTSNDAIKALEGKYGIVTKLRLRDQDYQNQADAYDKKLGFWGKKERSVSNVLSAFGNGIMDIPGAVVNYAGIGLEAATGLDLGASDAAKARGRAKVDYVTSTNRKRGILETTMNVDGYDVVFENNKATAVYDSKGYKVEDSVAETIGAKAQEKLNTDYEGKQAKLDWLNNTSFNFASLQQGVEDTAPQLAEIFLTGNFMKAGAGAVTANLAKTATSGSRVANVARVLSKPLQSARGIESSAMIPVFVKDMVDGAINDGAITPTQIFGTATTKLGMEAVAESMFAGPIGKMLSGKGISKAVFSKGLSEKLNDVIKYYATGKITSRDFMNHLGRAAKELVVDSGGEFVEEAFIEWTNGSVNEFLNSTLGTNYDEQTASAKEIFSAGLIGLAAGGVMSGPRVLTSIIDHKSGIRDTYQNLLSDVVGQTSASLVRGETVANPEAFKEYLSQAVQDGQIEQKDADKYSAAIQSAANRTSFTNDIDISTGAFKDLRDNRGLEARESFINLVRNTAFNKALTESLDTTNQFAQEEQSAKVQQYENVIKELELNAHKAVYSSATPTIIGLQRGLNSSQISELRNKQAVILDEVNGTKLNAVNKAKAVELKLNEAANVILKSKENISEKEQAQIDDISKQINTIAKDLEQTNTEEEAKAAVETGTAKPEQVQAELAKVKQSVDDLFTGQKTLKDNELPDFSIDLVQQLLENTPDMLKGEVSKYIDKKLEAINAQAYRQYVQNLNEQEKTAKPTNSAKQAPAVAFETRYNGNTELENTEWDTYKKDYIDQIETERDNAFTRGEADILTVLDEYLIAFENITSFKDAYINDPKFREFVDANTNAVASKPNTTITQEQKQAEADKKAKAEAKKQQEISKKQENIKDIAKDKELYEAAKLIVEKQYTSQAFLVKELGITNEKAKEILQKLEDNGVIGPNKVGKTREVYIKSLEEFNTLVPPASQSGVANTATANTSGSSVFEIEAKKAELRYSIQQLENNLAYRVEDFIKKGASLEEAQKIAYAEFPKADKEALEKLKSELATLEATTDAKAEIEIGKVGNTEYEIKVDGVYYQGKKLNNPENKTHRQLIEADIERRRQEELTKIIQSIFPNTQLNEIVYHGTRTQDKFDTFDETKIGELDSGYFGRGFYFSPDKSYAEGYSKQYNGYTIAAILNLQNPLETDANKANTNISLENNDGAIVRVGENLSPELNTTEYDANEIGEVVVKNSNQIHILSEKELNNIDKINAKYDAELKALEQSVQFTPVQQEQKTPVVSGRIEVTANGYGALNIADNLLVTDYLQAGDPVFYELSAKSTDAKPVIEKVVYYKDKSFGQPTKGSKRIILQEGFGKDEYKLSERFANEIKAGKERIETKATYVNLNKNKKLTPDNKKQLSIEEVEAIKPYLYVVGKSFSSDENIVLLNNEKDGENFLSVSDFISDLKDKHPDLKNFQEVENILRHKDVNGKVVFIKGNTIIPLDTITNEDYAPNKEFITEFLDKLSSEATGMADWRIDIDGRFLGDAVKKRSDVKDYTNETSPNFRGRLIEYFASGPQHRQANPTELLYKIKYNEEEGKSEPIYLTKEQALEELLAIRVNIDHADLRAENSSKGLDGLLADVLRVPAMPAKGFADLYNVVGLEDINGGSTDTIKLESEEVVTPEEKETTKTTSLKELKTEEPKKEGTKERKGGKKIDFKISDAEYNGKVEKAVTYLKTRFEEIGVEVNDDVLKNLVKNTINEGKTVWGAFHNAMVTLSSMSGEKIGRHESIHIAEIMFHTDAQIKAFRQEALIRYGKELGITKTKVDDLTDEELTDIREALATEFENYKNTLLLPEGFSKKYPTISKFIENLFNFVKKNYLIGKSYITNKKSIDQLFYEVENNILGRDFIGRRKKSVRDIFQKALNTLSQKDKPDFKISDWDNAEANKFANFLATDIFTKYLESTYRNNSVNEIIADNKDLSIETVINKFSSNLEQTLNKYKDAVVKREELEISSDEYQILEATLNDIYKQYASKDANKAFKQIVNKKLGNRYAGVVEFDKLEADDLLVDDENIKEVDEVEESQAESWQTKAGKIDAKTKSSARLREFFSSIPLRTRLVRNDKSERSTITDEDLFSTLYYSGEYIHNKLLLELSDNSNYEDFIKAVNGLVKKHQFGGDILAAIMNLTEEQLVEAYDNNTLELPLDVFTNPQAYGDYKLWILKDMYYAIGDQSNLQPIKTLTKNKGEQTTDAQIGLSVQDTDYDNATRTIKESVDNILTDTSKRESFKALLEETITAINEKGKVAGLIIKVFANMGYQVSDELLLNLQPTSSINGEEDNLTYLKKGLVSIVNDINDNNKTVIDVTGRGVDIPAKLISTYSTVSSGLSYMNVEGENEFAHQNSNHLSRVGAIWAKGANAMKQWVNNMRYVDGDPNKAIVLQSHLPIYEDMLDTANTFRIYQDGGTQVEGQTNSGKAYADMTFAELTAHSINLYLTKNNQKNAGNTIKKLHALFHVMVFSDSPKREMLHAPTYNGDAGHNRIIDKLINIVYGELERVGYAKAQENSSISELEKLSVAGKLIHTIPQLNDVKIKINGKYMPFVEFFATNLWTNPNSAIQISNVTTYKGIDKQGNTFESSLSGNTHRAMVSQIIKETLAKDYQHYIDTIYTSDVKKLVTSSATDSDIKDFYYNSYYYNISAGIMFSGDPAHYKLKNDSTNIERVKRDKQNVAPNIHLAFEKPTYDVIILKDVKANTSNVGNKEVAADLADASAWHTLERRIEILKASPDWELRKNELLPALEAIQNNKYTQKDLQTVHLQLLKPFVYAQVNKELPVGKDVTAYFKLPIQLKNAEAVLLPTEAYRVYGNSESYVRPESLADITADKYYSPELARTLFLMEKANVGTVVFESGSKGEIFGKVNLETYTEADIINMNTDKTRATTILTLKNSDWGLQMEVPRKDLQAKVGQGSQEHKIMSANVDENWTFTVANKTFSGQEGANDLLQQIQTLYAKENLTKVLKEIANEDGTLNIKEVLSIVSDTLIEKFTNIDTIEGLELQTDGKTLTPLELFGKKAEKVLNSLFKAVSKIKGSGAALVNKTSVGYVRDVEYDGKKGQLTPSNDLKLVRDKDGNILYYEAIVPVYDPIIYQFIDNNGELLLDENNNPLIPEKLLYSFFYRIPTEDKYSMFPIKIKKFSMPVEGGGIILPREATQTAGLDFDIDKLYGYYYNFKADEETNVIKLIEPNLKDSKSAHNLKLDVYFSLVNTKAYTRDALTPGNKNRLEALRDELAGSQYQAKYSYGDPSFIAKSANKNIVGKRLIGIFANGNSFYNLIQGAAKITLKNPIKFVANGVKYSFDSIGGINHQISKNIAELLFASTEDVKDPVLEPLNINTHTAPLLVTLLSMTNGTDIIKFEDAVKLLSDQSIIDAVKKAESEGKKFTNVYPRNGKYHKLIQMSEKYNAIVSASKIDQAIGPDFFTVQSKISNIDNIITDSIYKENYPFTSESVKSILPSSTNISNIKQLNVYREALDEELKLFKDVFSFLKDKVLSTLDILEERSKTGKLAPAKKYDIAYYMYDAAIQNIYGETLVKELTENFPTKLFNYNYPGNTGILKQAFEIDKKGIVKMRWVNTNATNILEQYKEAFSDLFTLDPTMAEELAAYAFLTGTKFKMDSIVKIVPNEFYKKGVGATIRNIINGNTLEDNLPENIANIVMVNHYRLILPKEEMVINGNTATLKNESFSDPKPFIWDNQEGIDVIYIHTNGSFYTKYHTVEKTKFPNYLINTGINITFAQNNDMTSVTTQSSTSINPLVAAGVKPTDMYGNAAKDIQMAEESTQFIGFQSGTAAVSSTDRYREAWGDKANTGNYSKNDVIMVSGSGLFRGVTEAQIKEVLTNKYKPLLDQAIAAGASFRVSNQYNKGNLSDQLIAEYLKAKGYVEEYLNGYSRWSSSSNTQSDSPLNGDDITPCTK